MPPSQYNVVANSTFLDAFGAVAVGSTTPAPAIQTLANNTANDVRTATQLLDPMLGYPGSPSSLQRADSGDLINVALMVERAAPQSQLDALLGGDWAQRQSTIAGQGNTIWSTFGADPAVYANTQQAILAALDNPAANPMSLAAAAGYSGSAENRTIWLQLRPEQFNTLFNSVLLADDAGYAWTGPLSLPSTIPLDTIAGLWVDQGILVQNPVQPVGVQPTTPGIGPVSLGNAAYGDYWIAGSHDIDATVTATPAAVAAYYNFPLATGVSSAPIALLETGLRQENLLGALNAYRQDLGLRPLSADELQAIGGTSVAPGNDQLELALDMSVISGVAPNSPIYLYGAAARTSAVGNFQAYQNAFFDSTRNPEILSSSYTYFFSMTANSPFQQAWQQLFVDGMLSGVSVHLAIGDQGSNGFQPNGAGNAVAGTVPTYALSVGGTSIAAPFSAANDSTLSTLYQLAMQGDPETVFELVAAGLTKLPSTLSTADPATLTAGATHNYAGALTQLIETVWNAYVFVADGPHDKSTGFTGNYAGSGGVDQTQPVPFYQSAYGLTPGVTPQSPNGRGRGAPDVAALAGGDAYYAVLNNKAFGDASAPTVSADDGTSAAAPLWATLTAQFNVIFKDQGLPALGFYNDLLYIASAIAPASFNDIVLGNNTSGFHYTAHNSGYIANDQYIQPTAAGYAATPGYDLVSGLGTPNGTLLARALTQIAHEQMYFDAIDPLLSADGSNWRAGAAESLLIQSSSSTDATVHLSLGSVGTTFFSEEQDPFAWTARLAQQSLQADFDPSLVTMFDRQAQGTLMQVHVGASLHVGVSIDGQQALTPQAGITTPFGFADFTTTANAMGFNPDVRVALPVAIAETAGGANDTVAIVRLRQNGEDNLAVSFLPRRRLHRDDRSRRAGLPAGRRQLSRGGAGPGLPHAIGRRVDRRAGLRPVQPDRAFGRRCRRHHRHDADQQHERADLLLVRPRQ